MLLKRHLDLYTIGDPLELKSKFWSWYMRALRDVNHHYWYLTMEVLDGFAGFPRRFISRLYDDSLSYHKNPSKKTGLAARVLSNLDAHRIWSDHMDRLRHIEMMRIHDKLNKPIVTSTYTPYSYYLPRYTSSYDYTISIPKRPSLYDFEKEFEDAVRTPVPYIRRSHYYYYPDTVTRSYVSSYPVTTRTYVSTYPIVRRSYLTPYRTRSRSYYISTIPESYSHPYSLRYLY